MVLEPGPSVWSDVRGDYAAARRAAEAMREAATAMEVARAQRGSLAARAREKWTGLYGKDFDTRLDQLQRESADIQARLLAEARRLDLAGDDAATDQRARVVDRQRIVDERQKAPTQPAAAQALPPSPWGGPPGGPARSGGGRLA